VDPNIGYPMREFKRGLSLVICHSGNHRLPNLAACLSSFRQCRDINEIILIETGVSPVARHLARRCADKYLFLRNDGPFERARTCNLGAALGEYDLVLWSDNDILVSPDFIVKAAEEIRTRALDYLIPHKCLQYLSPIDSERVRQGTANQADCVPVSIRKPVRDCCGALGIVRQTFLLEHGGIPEGFRGWGGEDDAWWHKACVLGRASVTQQNGQRAWHLFHPSSETVNRQHDMTGSTHYAKNITLLQSIRSVRHPQTFKKQFPREAIVLREWLDKRISIISQPMDTLASRVADTGRDFYGLNPELRMASPSVWGDLAESAPDAIVLFGNETATEFFLNQALEPHWRKAIIVSDSDVLPAGSEQAVAVCMHSSAGAVLQERKLRLWTYTGGPLALTTALLQPLSLVLCDADPVERGGAQEFTDGEVRSSVWMYWEGECPEWIRLCQQTIIRHGANVRLLSAGDFDSIRDTDRDIDLSRLHVAHRADFVRSFLLARFGGLWVDSDCIVMSSLDSILKELEKHDFVAHRERSGYFSNGFIAARRNSQIALELYGRICGALRSGQTLGWMSLGGGPLTKILNETSIPWRELPCEMVQPICWSNPGAFFAVRSTEEHGAAIDAGALCYMLSNTEVQRYQAKNTQEDLLARGTFFKYLIERSLTTEREAECLPLGADRAAAWRWLPFCLDAISDVSPSTLLDLSEDNGRWGILLREYLEQPNVRAGGQRIHAQAVESDDCRIPSHLCTYYDEVLSRHNGTDPLLGDRRWDLIILGQSILKKSLAEGSPATGVTALDHALARADYVLMSGVTLRQLSERTQPVEHWDLTAFLSVSPVRYAIYCWDVRGQTGSFLFSRIDPKGLRQSPPMKEWSIDQIRRYREVGDESLSGPGSSLLQTAEIRQRLPVLLGHLRVRSFLDAPCGDLNWMKHVELGVEDYVGTDIVPEVTTGNRKQFGSSRRRFVNLDLICDSLPLVDLIFCRDFLVHLSYEDIFRTLRNFKNSGSKYLLTTTFKNLKANTDIASGGWRPLNLTCFPFFFSSPIRLIDEKCTEGGGRYSDKSLGLWTMADVPDYSGRTTADGAGTRCPDRRAG